MTATSQKIKRAIANAIYLTDKAHAAVDAALHDKESHAVALSALRKAFGAIIDAGHMAQRAGEADIAEEAYAAVDCLGTAIDSFEFEDPSDAPPYIGFALKDLRKIRL